MTTNSDTPPRPPLPPAPDQKQDQAQDQAIDLAMLADKQVDGYGRRAVDRALLAQIQQAHRDGEPWT